jgi:hypothetical protein
MLVCASCGDPATLLGTLEITTQTRGEQRDEDGYDLYIDGELETTVGTDEATSIELAEGLHIVELAGIAGTCSVDGDNPATTSVYSAAPRALAFRVECGPGTLSVSAAFSGDAPAPGPLEVLVDGQASGSVAAGTPLTISLEPGVHGVGLGGVPERCTVSGTNPRSATVARNGTTAVSFALTCAASAASQP